MSSKLQLDVVTTVCGGAIWRTRMKAKGRHGVCRLNCVIHVWAPWGWDACHLRRYINPRTFTVMIYTVMPDAITTPVSYLHILCYRIACFHVSTRPHWQSEALCLGTNLIHGKKYAISREFLKCAKFHGKFTERVWKIHRPQPLFRGAMLMQTKKSVE